jgi:2-polyprenyl-3-methyl-5-hydroxy-6-metoxy-1,4-benzoquinol methylase
VFSCCVHTQAAARLFSHLAKLYVWRYRLFGLARSQLKLIAGLERIGYRAASLLEIGCGVGWLHQWLLKHGAARAIGVDLSPEMVTEARRLALKQGLAAQTSYLIGDFIALAESIEPVEIVLLDKVICCYPDANVLLIQAASRARRAVALTYPRTCLKSCLLHRGLNAVLTWIGSDFRTYLHDPKAVESCLKAQGLAKYFEACTFLWLTQVFAYAERG